MEPTIIPPVIEGPPSEVVPDYSRNIRSAASWLYWIAGMTLVNTAMVYSHSNFAMILGLNSVTLVNFFGAKIGGMAIGAALIFTLAASGGIFALGMAARKGATWAFIVAIVLLGIDTIPEVVMGSSAFLSIGIRIWAISSLVSGYRNAKLQSQYWQA